MPEIRLEHITKRWGKFYGVDDLNLVIENNAFVTLLGPSGCGKTTTLRMIAGLETPTSGRITIGDTVVFDSELGINIPANKRKVGFLFQNYALWPNMTVYQNISFGLSNIKEEMPKISFEAKNAARLAQILKNPQDVVKTLEECRDKNGKLDETKAIIKLIDTYTISQYTAQKLFGYHLEQGKDVSAEVKALEEKVEAARKAQPFNENFELLKDGKVEKSQVLNAENNWAYTFDRLAEGYTWTAEEAAVPAGYTVSYKTEGTETTITNTKNDTPPTPPTYPLDITVHKVWSNDNGKARPSSVTVTLYNGDIAYDRVRLSAHNNWTYTWKDPNAYGNWQVIETNIPKGYVPSYSVSADGTVVTITNSKSLIQTGQLNWPIWVLGGAGLALVALGGAMLVKKKKQNNA